ncbi:Riboflavin transporter RibZ [Baekduia alba]|uniref:MFS transporter n=1 Tax=Baekduia alba TaxID=2997333 RepID=UPI002341E240|nr:MFS transporter [Baekduia alba]WCB96328.1 Riboflavin transporter RibZ [Baekduia alba]
MSTITLKAPALGSTAIGLRLGALFGPSVFGVTAASVALPRAGAALGVSPVAATWVLTAHALALGVGTALFGRVTDVAGARVTMAAATVLLVLGAAICLLSPTLTVLVVGRLALAAGSGGLVATALALSASVPDGHRVEVLGWFGVTIAVFAASATLAGGAVTEAIGWRPTLVLPALAIAAIPSCRELVTLREASGAPLDLLGAALLAAAAAGLVVVIQAHALALPLVTALLVAAAAGLSAAALAVRSRRRADAFVPWSLGADRRFVGAALAGFGVYAGFFAIVYATPQLLRQEHGWDVLAIGAALLPGAVLGAGLSRAAAPLADRLGGAGLLAVVGGTFGAALLAAGLADAPPGVLLSAAAAGFAAFAVTQVVLTREIAAHVTPTQRGAAVGLLNLAFFIGGATGTATAGALADSVGLGDALALVAAFPAAAVLAAGALR